MVGRWLVYLVALVGGGMLMLLPACADLAGDSAADAAAESKKSGKGAVPEVRHLNAEQNARLRALLSRTARLEPLEQKLPPVRPGDWRAFWKEPAQPPQQYAAAMPVMITSARPNLYLCRVGTFSAEDERLFLLIRDYLARCFRCPVLLAPDVPVSSFPPSARTPGPKREVRLNSVYLTDNLLKPSLHPDGWAIFAVSANDIFQSAGLSDQYGDTLLFGRAGVISLYHLKTADRRVTLLRALKGASHEAAHLLSIPHCPTVFCNMNGRAGLAEFDRAPLWFCADCLTKLLYSCGLSAPDAGAQQQALADFCRANGLADEAEFFARSAQLLAAPPEANR